MTIQTDLQSIELLNNEWQLLSTSLKTLQLSVEKCKAIGVKKNYSFTEQESLDSLTSKFNRSSDFYTQKVLRSTWILLHEGFAPFIDMMNKMEKLNIIHSGEQLFEIRDLRNTIAHEYLPDALIDLIPEVIHYSAILDDNIRTTEEFLSARKWLLNL